MKSQEAPLRSVDARDEEDDVDEDEQEGEDEEDQEDEDEDEEEAQNHSEAPERIEEEESIEEEVQDPQLAKYDMDNDPTAPPAILITTSLPSNSTSPHLTSANARSHPAEAVREFIKELLNVFPGAEYRARAKAKGAGLGKICSWARARRFDACLLYTSPSPRDRG